MDRSALWSALFGMHARSFYRYFEMRTFLKAIFMAIFIMRAHSCPYLKNNTSPLASSAQNSALLSGSPLGLLATI